MKRIPKSFRLMGHTVNVQVIPASKWKHEDCVGFFDPERSLICIKRQAKASLTRQGFWHEAVHAILGVNGHKLYSNELFVDTFGGLLAQMMETAQ